MHKKKTTEHSQAGVRQKRHLPAGLVYVLCGVLAGVVLVVDLVVPRGPAPAIGYCAVVVLAGEARRPIFTILLAAACSFLTWLGYHLEPDGSAPWMSAMNRMMVGGVIWLTAVLEFLRVKDREALEERSADLARSNRELEHFASVVSHDLRSPLMSIKGWTQLRSRRLDPQSDRSAGDMLGRITSSVDEMSELVSRLLQYSRVSGRLDLQDCDTNVLLDRIGHALESIAEASGARIASAPLPVVRADETLLTQVMQNLVENAIKYRRSVPPRVHVSARNHPDRWEFTVRDNGAGIPEEDRYKVFDLFERAGQTRLHTSGSGIGLATCKRIIERHGGTIWVESEVGVGSTFHFTIPRRSHGR